MVATLVGYTTLARYPLRTIALLQASSTASSSPSLWLKAERNTPTAHGGDSPRTSSHSSRESLLSEITDVTLREYAEWEWTVKKLARRSTYGHLCLIRQALRLAKGKEYISELPDLPVLNEIGEATPNRAVLSPDDLPAFIAKLWRDKRLWAAWVIIRAILGLKLREACALRWQHIREGRIAIRQVYRGLPPRGSRPVNDQEHRDVPMPQIVGRFLLKLRKLAKFKRDEDFVFANVSGRNPVDSSDIMRKFLGPAAVSCGLPRRSVGKLERTCRLITKEHGLSFEFQRDVLRIHQRHQPYTQRDFKDTLAVLDECVAFVGLDKLMNEWNQEEDTVGAARPGALKKGKVVDQKERAKLSADRRPRITAFVAEKNRAAEEESRPRISNNAVYRVAGCSEADGRQWLDGWWPDSSVKSNRIEKVLSGETRFIDPGRGKIVDPNERAKLSADRRP